MYYIIFLQKVNSLTTREFSTNNYNQYVREIWETDGYLTIDLIGMKINELVKEKQK